MTSFRLMLLLIGLVSPLFIGQVKSQAPLVEDKSTVDPAGNMQNESLAGQNGTVAVKPVPTAAPSTYNEDAARASAASRWTSRITPIFSLVTNGISLAVFIKLHLQKPGIMGVLIALCVVDTFALIEQFTDALQAATANDDISSGFSIMHKYDAGCKIMKWLEYTCQVASAYLVLMYTVERFITIAFPLKARRAFNWKVTSVGIGVIMACCLASQGFNLYYQARHRLFPLCGEFVDKATIKTISYFLTTLLGLFVPYIFVIILNICIIWGLIKQRGNSVQLWVKGHRAVMPSTTTLMLLVASSLTVLLGMPKVISDMLRFNVQPRDLTIELQLLNIWTTFVILPWRYCVCFFVYFAIGKKFRQAFFDVITCGCCRRKGHATPLMGSSNSSSIKTVGSI